MKKTITLILLIISIVAFAQKNKEIERINNKIENINQKVDEINNRVTSKEIINKEKQKLYKEKFEQVNTTVKEAKEREDRFLSYIQWFFTIIGAVLLIFLGSSFWEFRNSLNKIKKEATDRVDNISEKIVTSTVDKLKSNSKYVKEIVDNNIWEFRLMAKAHIMIVNPETDDDKKNATKVLKFFKEKGAEISNFPVSFDKPDEIIQKVNQRFIKDRLNILLLENSDGEWNIDFRNNDNKERIQNAIKIAANIHKKVMLLYFGPKEAGDFPNRPNNYEDIVKKKYGNLDTEQKNQKIYEIIDTISFANTPSKLYPNLIDALKYLDIINPKINA